MGSTIRGRSAQTVGVTQARRTGATVVLAVLFVPLFVFVAHMVLEMLSPAMKALSSTQWATCEAGACQPLSNFTKFWILEGTFSLGTATLAVIPFAVAAARLRLNTWIVGAAIASGITALMLYKNTWAFFAPLGLPGWVYVVCLAAFVASACGLLGSAISRLTMPPDNSMERTREG